MLNMLLAADAGGQAGAGDIFSLLWPFALIIAVFYFLMIRPQKKREKATQEMRNNVEVGDEIVTIGGIIGRVVSIREDSLLIETGSDRSKIRISKWGVQTNNTVHERIEAEKSAKRKGKDKDREKDQEEK